MTFVLWMISCVMVYTTTDYKHNYEIIIPEGFVGEVKLFVSNKPENEFSVNEYGVGYINRETFDNGFNPVVLQNHIDITKSITSYSNARFATSFGSCFTYEYLSFEIPGPSDKVLDLYMNALIKLKAVDTLRLYKKC
jgi:hypothetical protein